MVSMQGWWPGGLHVADVPPYPFFLIPRPFGDKEVGKHFHYSDREGPFDELQRIDFLDYDMSP